MQCYRMCTSNTFAVLRHHCFLSPTCSALLAMCTGETNTPRMRWGTVMPKLRNALDVKVMLTKVILARECTSEQTTN